jgi:DNA-binding MarR family transcriptional regulator
MAKRRRYGDAWKDVQIDAEQNDAVFDRFFKKTQHDHEAPQPAREDTAASVGKGSGGAPASQSKTAPVPAARPEKRSQSKASVRSITPALPNISSDTDTSARVDRVKQHYRLSKGEAAVLKNLFEKASETGSFDCYAKIPQLAEACQMTHRGCQFALRNLETRGFIVRLKDYDPADRRGIQFRISLPAS